MIDLDKLQTELRAALDYLNISQIPEKLSSEEKRIWVTALLEVRKSDFSRSYAIGRNIYGKSPKIYKTFGNPAMIKQIVNIYPITWLESKFVPAIKSKDDVIDYITKYYNVQREAVAKQNNEDLKSLLYSSAIERQSLSQNEKAGEAYELPVFKGTEEIFMEIGGKIDNSQKNKKNEQKRNTVQVRRTVKDNAGNKKVAEGTAKEI